MAMTPQARRLLDRFVEVGVVPYDRMSVLEARESLAASTALQGPAPEGLEVCDLLVAGADGRLPARLYVPPSAAAAPLVVYFHGGGWVTGGIGVADVFCRGLAAEAGCTVASVDYRLSPETPFPGPVEDCFAATAWLAARGGELGAAPGRLAVCGDSAGGNLAAAVALMARDRGGPAIERQLLLYASLVRTGSGDYRSHTENGSGVGLTRGEMEWFWDHYLARDEDAGNPYAAPLLAPDLAGLPPAAILTTEFDVLRDEGVAYAGRLAAAGVEAEVEIVPGVIHGFLWMDRYFGSEVAAAQAWLARGLAAGAPPASAAAERGAEA
jgi:acetyl esterase